MLKSYFESFSTYVKVQKMILFNILEFSFYFLFPLYLNKDLKDFVL